jgi:hypothetical protein
MEAADPRPSYLSRRKVRRGGTTTANSISDPSPPSPPPTETAAPTSLIATERHALPLIARESRGNCTRPLPQMVLREHSLAPPSPASDGEVLVPPAPQAHQDNQQRDLQPPILATEKATKWSAETSAHQLTSLPSLLLSTPSKPPPSLSPPAAPAAHSQEQASASVAAGI